MEAAARSRGCRSGVIDKVSGVGRAIAHRNGDGGIPDACRTDFQVAGGTGTREGQVTIGHHGLIVAAGRNDQVLHGGVGIGNREVDADGSAWVGGVVDDAAEGTSSIVR